MIAWMLACAFGCQDPAGTPPRPEQAAPAPPAAVEAWDDKVAKKAVADLAGALKGSPSMAEKIRALDALTTGSNVQLLKPLVDLVEKDKSVVVKKRAAELIANQPAKEANAVIHKLLKNPRIASYPQVGAELVRGLARCGYDSKQWPQIADLFERDYQPECVPLHEAVLDLVTRHKEKRAIPMLLRNLDQPAPVDEHDPSNPPKEYWEARWKSWSAWKGKVKDALFAITGQRFSTAAEAEAWLKKNPL